MNFKFNKEKALVADKGGAGISTSGVFIGKLLRADFDKTDNGAKYLEFDFEEVGTELKARFLQIYLVNNDGSENFAAPKVHALMGLLGVTEAPVVEKIKDGGTDKIKSLPAVCFKPVGVILQRVNYKNAAGEDKYKFDILHFIDAKSKQTYSEIDSLLPAEIYLRPVVDKAQAPLKTGAGVTVTPHTAIKPVTTNMEKQEKPKPTEQQTGGNTEEDLPF
jgi:hypothetical protein